MNVRGCAAPLEGRAVLCLLNCGLCLRVPGRQAAGKRCAPGLLRCPRHGSRCAIQSTWRSPISSLPGATCEDRETVRATLAPGSELIALREVVGMGTWTPPPFGARHRTPRTHSWRPACPARAVSVKAMTCFVFAAMVITDSFDILTG